ncbi:divalent-cation tolerance protein CutA [Rubinisphaera italica]|uniref:Divalent-cation tolerance protein CutA n=1 Tax=Rubinisphaera italica TaxID=2527969 RepID=A0A5C5XDH3_9PLAN|nr:divalent-cation tolerance protein CutA [Rubinisphaera italica]TWT60175.1 Divalent-cation tolerance protein CutA [Rubinisphaera italica]
MSQTGCQLIYSTTSSVEEATSIGKTLVHERLAACVNILPGMQSIYQWQGQTEMAQEAVLLVKTTTDHSREVIARIETLHSYDCPAVVVLDIATGSLNYLNWLRDQVEE